jgi:hypothetical protein
VSRSEQGTVSESRDAARGARSPRAWQFVTLGLAAGLAAALACADLLGPTRDVTPQLDSLGLDLSLLSGIMYINGVPADSSFRLESGRRVPVEISVSSGDRESAGLYRTWCPPRPRRPYFHCFRFSIGMESGIDVRTLSQRVGGIGGRWEHIYSGGWLAEVTLFYPDAVRGAQRARSWPGVKFTELFWPGSGAPQSGPDPGPPIPVWKLTVPVLVDTGTAVPHDGTMQVRSGDTVVVLYRQPAGGVLEARGTVP